MTVVAEQLLDLLGSEDKVVARLFSPVQKDESTWTCRFEIGAPINEALDVHGVSGLQALALALRNLSAALYSTDLYKNGQLGSHGEFGGYLGIPAPGEFRDVAPYTF
jgi:hypothetical protein